MNKEKQEKIKKFIEKKIITYLKTAFYSSKKLKKKLQLLPKKYPDHYYYPLYTDDLIDEVINKLENLKVIDNECFLYENYEILKRKTWSNKKIYDYLEYKLLFPHDLIQKLKNNIGQRNELENINEISRKINIKIQKWQRKYNDDYIIKQKIKEYLYKEKYKSESIEQILNILLNN